MNRYLYSILVSTLAIFAATQCGPKGTDEASGKLNDAKVIFAIGDVKIKKYTSWASAMNQMKLTQGDEIKTGNKSQCNIVIGKDSFISIKEKSHLILEKIIKDVSGAEDNQLALKIGKSVVNPKKLLKGDSFRIKTPTAIAAVRGTKFVVESKPGERMKVAVVDGKVELKRRVPVLEKIDKEVMEKSEALMTLKEKIEEETIVIDANESAFIDNKKAEAENKIIKEAVTEQVEVIKKEIEEEKELEKKEKVITDKPEEKKIKIENRETVVKQEKRVKKVFASLLLMKKKKNEVKQIKKQEKVEIKYIEEVKKLDEDIADARSRKLVKVEKKEEIAQLKISSPVRGSAIYINTRFIGYDNALLKPETGEELNIKIMARGYRPFVVKLKLKKGETKTVTAVMNRAATLTVISPVKNGRIYINSQYIGRGKALINPEVEKILAIQVKAPGFKEFNSQITVNAGEQKVVKAELIRKKKLERINWQHKMGKTVLVKPVVYGKNLIIATNDGNLLMVNREGKRIWKADLKRRIESTPLVYRNKIYVATSNGDFYSLNARSGGIVWKKKIFGSLLFGSRPIVAAGSLYLATSFGRVYSFSITGKEKWHVDLENGVYSSVTYREGLVYVGAEDHNIYALNAKDGDIEWKFKADSRMVSSAPTIKGNTLYIGCYSGSFFAIDASKGSEKWKLKTGDSIFSTPLIIGNSIYLGSNDGKLYAILKDSGKVLWKFNAGSKVKSKAASIGNLVVITSGKRVLALDKKSGALQWAHIFKKEIKTSASISGNDIFVGLEDGEIASVRNSLLDTYR